MILDLFSIIKDRKIKIINILYVISQEYFEIGYQA
jgi:hypothetical protein